MIRKTKGVAAGWDSSMSYIFVSYSRSDRNFASRIVQALAEGGPDQQLDTWIDWKNIPKGEDWEQEIYRGIEGADAFLFLISPDSVSSEICNREIGHALRNGKRILPIFIANVGDREIYTITERFVHKEQKEEICRRNFILCRPGDDFEGAIEEIRTTIHTDYNWLTYHTKLQVKALEWERRSDSSRLLRGRELREAEQQLAEVNPQEDPRPTRLQREYILASRREEDRQRRRIVLGLGMGSLFLLGIAILAIWQWQRADELANLTLVRQLLAQVKLNQTTRLDQALLLSVEAIHRLETEETRNNLLEVIHEQPELVRYLPLAGKPVASGYSPDGEMFMAFTDTGMQFWDAATGEVIEPEVRVLNGQTVFTKDHQVGFSAGRDRIDLWDLSLNPMPGALDGQQIYRNPSGLSPDGSIKGVITGNRIELLDSGTGRLLGRISDISDFDGVYYSTFSADNRLFLVVSDENDDGPMIRMRAWELPDSFDEYYAEYEEIFHTSRLDGDWRFTGDQFSDNLEGTDIIPSPDGKNIAVMVRKTSEIQYLLSLPGENSFGHESLDFEVPVSALSPECNGFFAVGREDGRITVEQAPANIPSEFYHPGRVEGLMFSPDCNRLASLGDGSVVLWDFSPRSSILWLDTQPAVGNESAMPWNYSGNVSTSNLEGKTAISSCLKHQNQADENSPCYLSEVQFENVKFKNFPRNDKVGDASVVTALALSPNGEILALGVCRNFQFNISDPEDCSPGEVWLAWKEVSSSKGTEIHLGDLTYAVTGLEFDQGGNILTSVGQDGTIIQWDMDPSSWEAHACKRVSRNFTSPEWNQFIGGETAHVTCLR